MLGMFNARAQHSRHRVRFAQFVDLHFVYAITEALYVCSRSSPHPPLDSFGDVVKRACNLRSTAVNMHFVADARSSTF